MVNHEGLLLNVAEFWRKDKTVPSTNPFLSSCTSTLSFADKKRMNEVKDVILKK